MEGVVVLKNNRFIKGCVIFFAIIGFLVTLTTSYLFITYRGSLTSLATETLLLKTKALKPADTLGLIRGAMRGMVDSLNDPYSAYLDPNQYRDLTIKIQATFGGIGIVVGADEENRLKVVSALKNTPAERAGIKSGDVITRINEDSTQGMSLDDAVRLMRGEPGTQVTVGVYRESERREYEFTITREIINVPSVESRLLQGDVPVGYVHLLQFTATSASEMEKAIHALVEQKARGLILDLRDNPGGDFQAALDIADLFLNDGVIVKVRNRYGREVVHEAHAGAFDMPFVVLVNGGSASSSEILAGALKDHGVAPLVGEKTFGKGLVQTVYPLAAGDALKLTTDKYFTPKGTDIDHVGIAPDYTVPAGKNGEDQQLARAKSILLEEISSRNP